MKPETKAFIVKEIKEWTAVLILCAVLVFAEPIINVVVG